ncbi:MazG nucleotide pyrophosphohydrolase domain-containing protein [Mycobacterium leprae]|uniref:MazG nucleotide pyrophosphohydrolase domain-containing protein n=1 Tax=Mycobacterium leprae TaxID=1769 RepID=UPI000AF8854E|nr:MazG nucleotide pyrophosphohydrolase domain-containing protein [Mycobacterium leprae]
MREELGYVLLQVLFHACIVEGVLQLPFTVEDVAVALMGKLCHRVLAVLAVSQFRLITN